MITKKLEKEIVFFLFEDASNQTYNEIIDFFNLNEIQISDIIVHLSHNKPVSYSINYYEENELVCVDIYRKRYYYFENGKLYDRAFIDNIKVNII